ncbi:MAG: hypothetical protein KJ646_00105 [Nanoarchaeota archaeon]|nr:hypothetical protein [Nanoarchaeota archaeon]
MLTKKQITEIREHLHSAQNPLFFFDNDADGLCSFLLLQRYIERGKGVSIKSFPSLTQEYFRRVKELNADYIFILDKPSVSKDFFNEARQINIPIVWIDHHATDLKEIPDYVHYYNPFFNKLKTTEPVTDICYQITSKKDDLWIAVAGCIADNFVPDFYLNFKKKYSDLSLDSKNAFDIFYKTEIGKIARIFNFALKDKTTNVIHMLKFLMKIKTPYEVLEENSKNYAMHNRFNEINKKIQKLIEKAKQVEINHEKLLFFQYGGNLSISSDLSNELSYIFPEKIIVVVYITGTKANISARGIKVKNIILNAILDLKDSTGGGHENAVGAKVKIEDLEIFRTNLIKLIK